MIVWRAAEPLILASQSEGRRTLLEGIGIRVRAVRSDVVERDIEARLLGAGPADLALELAKAKALSVSEEFSNDWVLGCDQVLEHQDRIVHKAADRQDMVEKLRRFSGSPHVLHSACVLSRGRTVERTFCSSSRIWFRDLTEMEIDNYIDANLPRGILSSVGSYHFEADGIGLISHVEGEKSSIMGLPILDLVKQMADLKLIH